MTNYKNSITAQNLALIFISRKIEDEDQKIYGEDLTVDEMELCLKNCEINGSFSLFDLNGEFPTIVFDNVKFSSILIHNCILTRNTRKLSLSFGNIIGNSIRIVSSTMGLIKMDYIRSADTKSFNFSVTGSTTADMDIGDSVFEYFQIERNSTIGEIQTSNSHFENLWIKTKSIVNRFGLGSSSAGKVLLHDSQLNTLDGGSAHIKEINLTSSEAAKVYLKKIKLDKLRIESLRKFDLSISSSEIKEIELESTSLSSDSTFSISESSIYLLYIVEFNVVGKLFLRSINPLIVAKNDPLKQNYAEPSIVISQSSLGKTEFTDCNLGGFQIHYNNSKIIDCFISGGVLPKKDLVIPYKIGKDTEEWNLQIVYFYNQLRKIFESQGDVYQATKFQVDWATALERLLSNKTKINTYLITILGILFVIFSGLTMTDLRFSIGSIVVIIIFFCYPKLRSDSAEDLYTLQLNKISNNHGESWLRALGLTFTLGGIFYVLFLWSIGLSFNSGNFDIELVGYLFEFINPIHKIDFLSRKCESCNYIGVTIYIDFISRLIISYFIYQFISAFRKHTKKN